MPASPQPLARLSKYLAFLALAYPVTLAAQIQNGNIVGLVTDPSDAVIVRAHIIIKNSATGYQLFVESDSEGSYSARELMPGPYTVSAQAVGFQSKTVQVTLTAGSVLRVNLKLSLTERLDTAEVQDTTVSVDLENARLMHTLDASMVANLPLNGRNIYDLVQYAPGATNTRGVIYENGAGTVVNGVRQNFNGFLINGLPDTGLTGGPMNHPIVDTVDQFQVLTLNNSAEFGSVGGAITTVVTKSGTNHWHGSAWEFFRNEALDANSFFANDFPDPASRVRVPFRLNQFGGTLGGPILKNKLFFFAAYQGDRFLTSSPGQVLSESAGFRSATAAAFPNSVAALLYSNFAPKGPNSSQLTLRQYVNGGLYSGSGFTSFADYLCPANTDAPGTTTPGMLAQKFAHLFGVEQTDIVQMNQSCPGGSPFTQPMAGAFDRDDAFLVNTLNTGESQSDGDFFNGNEASLRLDYNHGAANRFFLELNWSKAIDRFASTLNAPRGFLNPSTTVAPNLQFTYIRMFSPNLVNELQIGYAGWGNPIKVTTPGVPFIAFDDGSLGFGSYAGYPQFFRDNIYNYGDLLSISHSAHTIKIGANIKRNIENSEYNYGRPSYFFFDPLFFALDAPYAEAAGVDPGFTTHQPAELATNKRHWHNLEFGAYVQDNWKLTPRLTLNLGLRYDLFTRLVEQDHLATTFLLGPGRSFLDNITTGEGQIKAASTPCPGNPLATIAGVCGPGGFTSTSSLGKGDHDNFAPRLGFSWDPFGDGKTALRGSFGIAYEGILYNPQSDTRWNPPYYSLNLVTNNLAFGVNNVVYGPVGGGIPTFSGPAPSAQHAGVGAQATGNISGWDPNNPEQAGFTGIVLPNGLPDPYVENWFLGLQRLASRNILLELNYVATAGRRLPHAASVNRVPGGLLPEGTCVTDTFGRKLCSQIDMTLANNGLPINPYGSLNPNYGRLRVWENNANSIYNALQLSVRARLHRGLQFHSNYTYSHSIDSGSAWHNGATSANGYAGGDAFPTDPILDVDRGNSTFDIRHRLVFEYSWQLGSPSASNALLRGLGSGWRLNGILALQTGAHWSPFKGGPYSPSRFEELVPGACTAPTFDPNNCINTGSDYNLDGEANDRPNALANHLNVSHDQWAKGFNLPNNFFSTPCLGCVGNVGRNTFEGPGYWSLDASVFRSIRINDQFHLECRVEAYNVMNHTNFLFGGYFGPSQTNNLKNPLFGQAGGTSNPRNLQLGVKVVF